MATTELLMGVVEEQVVRRQAEELDATPIPYSTHDLALSVALSFFKNPEYVPHLAIAQLMARLQATQWLQQGLVVPIFVRSLEEVLYKLYSPVPK